MTELLFHTPWWLPTFIAAVGIGLFIYANNRQEARLRAIGLGVVGLSVLLIVVSYFVDTDIETVSDRTDALLASVENRQWDRFRGLLAQNSSFRIYHGKDELASGAQLAAEKFNVKKARVISREINATDSLITVTLSAYSEQDLPPGPMRTGWEFDWQKRGKEWLLGEIRLTSINNQPMNDVDRYLPSGRK